MIVKPLIIQWNWNLSTMQLAFKLKLAGLTTEFLGSSFSSTPVWDLLPGFSIAVQTLYCYRKPFKAQFAAGLFANLNCQWHFKHNTNLRVALGSCSSHITWQISYTLSFTTRFLLTTWLQALHIFRCYINVIAWTCSRFYWYICTLPQAVCTLRSHAYIPVKPLITILQHINGIYLEVHNNIYMWHL